MPSDVGVVLMKRGIVKNLSTVLAVAALLAVASSLSGCKPHAEASPPDLGESIVVSAFPQEYQDFELAVDTAFSKELIERLSYLGDDPATGFRTAGSPAETEAADLVEAAMRRAGLQNVTRERATADSWVFGGASIIFENRKGERERIDLGGYPVNLVADGQALMLVDAGAGKAADYEGLDVRGKLVLVSADPGEADANVGFLAVQAKILGAKAVIVCMDADPAALDGKLVSHDFGAPSDAPAFAIDDEGYSLLRTALKRAGEAGLPVILNADSVVAGGAQTENIWGEIPGKSVEVIYMLANYDGFYHSVFEGAAGVSAMLGVAKGLCDSGFLPQKTIRFVACGAGEWGAVNTPFDGEIGAWRQLSQLHPEWPETAFAVLNADAVYPFRNKNSLGMAATDEIYNFASRSAGQLADTGMYGFTWYSSENPSDIVTEDSVWNLFGVPAVAARPGEGDKSYQSYIRSSRDTIEAVGFDDDAYRFICLLYGKLILDLDAVAVRPLDFERGLLALRASVEALPITNARLTGALSEAATDAATLAADIEKMNTKYLGADEDARASLERAAADLNRELYAVNRKLRDAFARFDRRGTPVLPHTEAGANIESLREALTLLADRDAAGAVRALRNTDFGRYADYGAQVCDYFAAQGDAGTWAAGRAAKPVCRADLVAASLERKLAAKDPDMSAEEEGIDALLAQEELYLRGALDEELLQIEEIAPRIKRVIADIAPQIAGE
jgi:hypothetical protein